MKRLLFLIALLCLPQAALAQVGGQYWMRWSATGGATGANTGGAYSLQGIAGAPEAGTQQGGNYVLMGGFWVPALQSTVAAEGDPVPRSFVFRAPTPSPFHDQATLAFELPQARRVSVFVHSVDGRLVRKLVDRDYGVGRHTIFWDAKDDDGRTVPSGMYFVRLVAGAFSASRRLVRLD